jgi:hypothetical protein
MISIKTFILRITAAAVQWVLRRKDDMTKIHPKTRLAQSDAAISFAMVRREAIATGGRDASNRTQQPHRTGAIAMSFAQARRER